MSKLTYDPKPGMLVRCLVQFVLPPYARGDETLPRKGTIYTIRQVAPCVITGAIVLTLSEIVNERRVYRGGSAHEPAWRAELFAPVDPKAIDVFREIAARNGLWARPKVDA